MILIYVFYLTLILMFLSIIIACVDIYNEWSNYNEHKINNGYDDEMKNS